MSKKPNHGQSLALRAAAAAAAQDYASDDEFPSTPSADDLQPSTPSYDDGPSTRSADDARPATRSFGDTVPATRSTDDEVASDEDVSASAPKPRGRPKGRRDTKARQTVHLDEARHSALARLAQDQGTSVHALILAGIDHIIGKPKLRGWDGSAE